MNVNYIDQDWFLNKMQWVIAIRYNYQLLQNRLLYLRVGMTIMNKFGFETNVLKVFDAKINLDKWKV